MCNESVMYNCEYEYDDNMYDKLSCKVDAAKTKHTEEGRFVLVKQEGLQLNSPYRWIRETTNDSFSKELKKNLLIGNLKMTGKKLKID